MKPKTLFISVLTLFASMTMNAQTILKGDMNNDEKVTIADVTSLVNVILGKSPIETINVGGAPFAVDNSMVAGTWYTPNGDPLILNADGTTNFYGSGSGATYKFFPSLGRLVFYDSSGRAGNVFGVIEVSKDYLLIHTYEGNASLTYYTNQNSLVTALSMSESTLTINSGTTYQLSVSATPETAFYANVKWSSSDRNVATVSRNGLVTANSGGTCTITATATDGSGQSATCELTVIQMVTSITLSEASLALALDGYKKLTATVLPSDVSNPRVTWSSSDDNVAEVTSAGGVAAVGRGSCVITCTAADGSGITAQCIVYVHSDDDYVNLGLPSGTLWATCNVGASSPEDYGDYFAWGETKGYKGKMAFDWSTYKWCKGLRDTITKYCTQSEFGYNGFTDNKTELDPEDDAAYVNWGSEWRMPSETQYKELFNRSYTIIEWTQQNGVNGYKITSRTNDNSIFLPAAGGYIGMTLKDAGSDGVYWPRTLGSDDSGSQYFAYYAWPLWFKGSDVYVGNARYYDNRCNGNSVRPVRNTTE